MPVTPTAPMTNFRLEALIFLVGLGMSFLPFDLLLIEYISLYVALVYLRKKVKPWMLNHCFILAYYTQNESPDSLANWRSVSASVLSSSHINH